MRPMPFCVLDEIEAALDEANVARYAKYLKKFAQETQFIVITHRKPTMENADILFGVTMEEKGVSKVVSVKLSEVQSRLGVKRVVAIGIIKLKLRFAAAEKFFESALEVFVDELEAVIENFEHFTPYIFQSSGQV